MIGSFFFRLISFYIYIRASGCRGAFILIWYGLFCRSFWVGYGILELRAYVYTCMCINIFRLFGRLVGFVGV